MTRLERVLERGAEAASALRALRRDVERAVEAMPPSSPIGRIAVLGDASVWVLTLLRVSTASRALLGTGLGLRTALRVLFHVDAWSDDIGPGLRLPHPFNIVVGEGAHIGEDCTLMHNVTIQRGKGTEIGNGAILGVGTVVLEGARVGRGSLVGAMSLVRGEIPADSVAVGTPARVVRAVREGET